MLTIRGVQIEHSSGEVITDEPSPRFSFALESDHNGTHLETYRILVSEDSETVWDSGIRTDRNQTSVRYAGSPLKPDTEYRVLVEVSDSHNEQASASAMFRTGRMHTPWNAEWITGGEKEVREKKSPVPLLFRKKIILRETPEVCLIRASALGIYDLYLNGKRVSETYFAPGFTSYHHQIQYQTFHADTLHEGENEIRIQAGAGWAVGAFTYARKNQTYTDRISVLMELIVRYPDGSEEVIGTDTTWEVTDEGKLRYADWYDGEVYDASIEEEAVRWKQAEPADLKFQPNLIAQYGVPVTRHQVLEPKEVFTAPSGERIYDFGQNFAGVIAANIRGKKGQVITFRHAEVLDHGELFIKPLRTARASAVYTCRDGEQFYSPRMTYMGSRYAGVTGIDEADLTLHAYVLHSDVPETGSFECSDERLNQLQHNIRWGAYSNFMDIPTDCPQRDERMGWTGDIAVFASTACFNFDLSRFLEKWLKDLGSEQLESGALPMTVPKAGDTWKERATGCWGDACVLVPYAEYMARGDLELLRKQYPVMVKFLKEAERRASIASVGKHRRIWSLPFQFGDWCAPDEDFMRWILKGKWVATAYFANSCNIVSRIAELLGHKEDADYYQNLYHEISDAYMSLLCKKDGTLKKEFQTAYVLPLYFAMAQGTQKQRMAERLAELVKEAGYHPRTGFPGTPYLLFALADNGQEETAFRTLLDEGCPGWLYSVKAGATTIWERWDALRPDGSVNTGEHGEDGGMVSFNHYANGAAGDFLYRRIAGMEPASGGWKTFKVKPMITGSITHACAELNTPYGKAASRWKIHEGMFEIEVEVPVSAECTLTMPSGETRILESGTWRFSEPFRNEERI